MIIAYEKFAGWQVPGMMSLKSFNLCQNIWPERSNSVPWPLNLSCIDLLPEPGTEYSIGEKHNTPDPSPAISFDGMFAS